MNKAFLLSSLSLLCLLTVSCQNCYFYSLFATESRLEKQYTVTDEYGRPLDDVTVNIASHVTSGGDFYAAAFLVPPFMPYWRYLDENDKKAEEESFVSHGGKVKTNFTLTGFPSTRYISFSKRGYIPTLTLSDEQDTHIVMLVRKDWKQEEDDNISDGYIDSARWTIGRYKRADREIDIQELYKAIKPKFVRRGFVMSQDTKSVYQERAAASKEK